MSTPGLPRLDRREAIKWMLTAAASVAVLNSRMSATDAPAFAGSSFVPVTDTKPASLWISRS